MIFYPLTNGIENFSLAGWIFTERCGSVNSTTSFFLMMFYPSIVPNVTGEVRGKKLEVAKMYETKRRDEKRKSGTLKMSFYFVTVFSLEEIYL